MFSLMLSSIFDTALNTGRAAKPTVRLRSRDGSPAPLRAQGQQKELSFSIVKLTLSSLCPQMGNTYLRKHCIAPKASAEFDLPARAKDANRSAPSYAQYKSGYTCISSTLDQSEQVCRVVCTAEKASTQE